MRRSRHQVLGEKLLNGSPEAGAIIELGQVTNEAPDEATKETAH
jgi:hypothetical protein